MKINLHLLRIFHAVIRQDGFSRAAQSLFISQPAVSKGIRELEHQLGLVLILRGSKSSGAARNLCLTDDGRAVFEYAEAIFSLERTAVEDVQARVNQQRGRLVVGASTTVGAYWLPSYGAALTQQRPDVDLCVQVGNTQAVAQALIDGRVDIALVEGSVDDKRLDCVFWRDDDLVVVASADSPLAKVRRLTRSVLSDQVWLRREAGSGTREATEQLLQRLAIKPQRYVDFGSNEGIARAVAERMGIAMLPNVVVSDLIALRKLIPLHPSRASKLARPLWLLQFRQRPVTPLVRAFIELLMRRPATLDKR